MHGDPRAPIVDRPSSIVHGQRQPIVYRPSSMVQKMFIDSHAHIDSEEFDADRDDVVARARDAGVSTMLNVATGDPKSGTLERGVEVSERYDSVYAAIGVHPHDARHFDAGAEEILIKLLDQSSRIIAWGEIGLDYYYDNSPRDVQREVFRRQLQLAREADLPVIIHSREAEADTITILKDEVREGGCGVMHCFSGSETMMREAVGLGFMISFAGNVTFKKAEDLRVVAAEVPLDRLLIETDCPFLTPVPFRGRRNEPARVVETARFLAELRGTTIEEIAEATTANFFHCFGLIQALPARTATSSKLLPTDN